MTPRTSLGATDDRVVLMGAVAAPEGAVGHILALRRPRMSPWDPEIGSCRMDPKCAQRPFLSHVGT